MKEKQNTKGNTDSRVLSFNRKRNTSNRRINIPDIRKPSVKIIGKKEVRVNAVSKAAKKEIAVNLSAEITRIYKSLKALCIRWEKADKENQRLLCMIIWGVPYSKKSRRKLSA